MTNDPNCRRAVEYINAGAPFIVFDIKSRLKGTEITHFNAIKCIQQDGYFRIIGNLHICDRKQIVDFLGKNPVLLGYTVAERGIEPLRIVYSMEEKEFTPTAVLDIRELAKTCLGKGKYDIKSVSEQLDVNNGIKFDEEGVVTAMLRIFNVLYFDYGLSIETPLVRVEVKEASYWKGPTKNLERIYIKTVPRTEFYYDIIKKTWVCKDTHVDMECAIRDAVFLYKASSIKHLCDILKGQRRL